MKCFNQIYAKYMRQDYFSEKEYLRNRINEAKVLGGAPIPYGAIKNYLKRQKQQCKQTMVQRLEDYKLGRSYPKREKFTWEVIKANDIIN